MNVPSVIFFDLDDTLIHEDATDEAMIVHVAKKLLPEHRFPERDLVRAVRAAANDLWYRSDAADYCRLIQTSPIEGLYGDYAGDDPALRAIQAYIASGYRERVWSQALGSVYGKAAEDLALVLARAYAEARASRHVHFPDAAATLDSLAASFRLALITNGAPRVQRGKLVGSGLAPYFDPVVVSGEFGMGKPHPSIYQHALSLLGVEPGAAVMVGNSLRRDVVGAQAVGIRGVWFNPSNEGSGNERPWRVATRLSEIPTILREVFGE